MSAKELVYVPGVCNIGPAEIRRRWRVGWLGAGASLLLWLLFWLFRVPALWRLLLFLPAMAGASGFIQAASHFCAGFGMRGVFNLGPVPGRTQNVEEAESLIKDQRRSRHIGLYSALAGAAVAMAGFLSA